MLVGYFLWDMTTLVLYVIKIRSLKKYEHINPDIYKRISLVFYEVITGICCLSVLISIFVFLFLPSAGIWIAGCIMSIAFSFSMYLMLEHNAAEYISVLKFIEYICCWTYYASLIRNQMNLISTQKSKLTNVVDEKNINTTIVVEETEYGTEINDPGIEIPKSLSLPTMTVVDQINITDVNSQ